jgi:hypothetical protein
MSKKKKTDLDQIKEQYIQDLRAGQRYSIGKFDEQVLLISSSALVLSLNFIGEIVKLDKAVWKGFLYVSWWLLALTMIISVVTHLISYNLHERQIKRVEKNEELPDDKFTIGLNYSMAVALVLGIALQIIFVTKNASHMSKENQSLNEIKIDSLNVNKDSTIIKGMPVSSTPVQLKPGSGTLGAPVQSAPKDIKAQIDSTSSGNKK